MVALVRTAVTDPQSIPARGGPTSMGDRRRTGDRAVPSTQATSSTVRVARRARSSARFPPALRARARRPACPPPDPGGEGSSSALPRRSESRALRRVPARESSSDSSWSDADPEPGSDGVDGVDGGDGGDGVDGDAGNGSNPRSRPAGSSAGCTSAAPSRPRVPAGPSPGTPMPDRAGRSTRSPVRSANRSFNRSATSSTCSSARAACSPRAKGRARAASARNRPGASSTPRLAVMTSSTSWASSRTRTSCGGRTAPPLARWDP